MENKKVNVVKIKNTNDDNFCTNKLVNVKSARRNNIGQGQED